MIDSIYADNYGIPTLISQSVSEWKPITSAHKWGVAARGSSTNGGLVHFYTDDYKFTNLWNYPQKLLHTKCHHVIEVNYSTYHTFPLAYMLWNLYQKRTMSLLWQQNNVITWIDVNVDPCMYEYNFMGVPRTHGYYATRYLANYPRRGQGFNSLEQDFKVVKEHCTVPFIFLVYGGGIQVKEYCYNRDWLWLPDRWSYPWEEVLVQPKKEGLERMET